MKNMRFAAVCRLAFAMVLCLLLAVPALADDAYTWQQVKEIVAAAPSGTQVTVTLQADMQADSTLDVSGGIIWWPYSEYTKDIVLDLNGHTITRTGSTGSVIRVGMMADLVIKDSKPAQRSVNYWVTDVARDNDATDGTGIARPSTFDAAAKRLTWYETQSMVNFFDHTQTMEYDWQISATGGGGIDANGSTAPIITAESGWADGQGTNLRIEGGMFYGSSARAINYNGFGKLDIAGGYIFDNEVSGGNGGGVNVQGNWERGVDVTLSGNAAIIGNKGMTGGGLYLDGKGTFAMSGGTVSGNAATGTGLNVRYGGGGMYVGSGFTAAMTGGIITNNWGVANLDKQDNYECTGGGVLVRGQFRMSGGLITGNEAAGGGGLSTEHWQGGSFIMTGGTIAGNYARQNEGGGVTINGNGKANIVGGYITNNVCETEHHWGGGGIFMADQSLSVMRALLVTDNHAGGFGGGGAGCPTGRFDSHGIDFQKHSIAMFDNTADGENLSGDGSTKSEDHRYAYVDEVFMREGDYYQDYFSALSSTFCCGMLGGGMAKWIGTVDGREFSCDDHEHPADGNIRQSSQYITGLTSRPTGTDKQKAINAATVYVTGNRSNTHGGGFLCDGYLIVGVHDEMELGDRMEVIGNKSLEGAPLQDEQFEFEIVDVSTGEVLTTGTNDEEGTIIFKRRIAVEEPGTYTYIIREVTGSEADVQYDDEEYTLVVTVTQRTSRKEGIDEDGYAMFIDVIFNQITHIKLTDKAGTVIYDGDVDSADNSVLIFGTSEVNFVNKTGEKGSLTVEKTVTGTHGDQQKAFTFTVTLSDKTISGVYGEMTFVDGVATFTLKHGETKTASGLPADITYTVTETADPDYETTSTGASGSITTGVTAEALFTNDRSLYGGLAVSKKVEGTHADTAKAFTFTVTLADSSISGTYGDMTFADGAATFTLKHGETKTATGLPADMAYTVAETPDPDYATLIPESASGSIPVGGVQMVEFVNGRSLFGSLLVKKTVTGTHGDPDKAFTFTVTLSDKTISGVYGEMTFVDGVATFTLKHGESKLAAQLPADITYTVTETADPEYQTVVPEAAQGTVAADKTTEVAFVNSRDLIGGLKVEKTVTGTHGDTAKKFTFTVTLADPSVSGTYGDMTFVDGVATFTLSHGESAEATGLEAGIGYTVTETADPDYTTTVEGAASGTIPVGDIQSVTYVNDRSLYGGLSVSKTVSGTHGDQQKAFTFTVTLTDKTVSGVYGDMTFVDGVATFTLKHGETKTADGLPADAGYTVTEAAADDYTVESSGAEGFIPVDDIAAAAFENSSSLFGGLKVTKTLAGNDVDESDEFTFTVTLSDTTISGTYGGMTFEGGAAVFTLKGGESLTASGLPAGVGYTVTEAGSDYVVTSTGAQGEIVRDEIIACEFVNTRNRELTGNLTISKTVAGAGADLSRAFSFTLTLSDTTVSGVYGDLTFEGGVASFTLTDGQTVSATGLPHGAAYEVTEDSDGYNVTMTNATGTIQDNTTIAVSFVNTLGAGNLTVKKTITGDAADMEKRFTFRVTLSDTSISGTYGGMTFVGGVAEFMLGHGEQLTAVGLPEGITYSVEELDSEDYVVSMLSEYGKIPAEGEAVVSFVNNRDSNEGPSTGDDSRIGLYAAMLALSSAAMAALILKKRRA